MSAPALGALAGACTGLAAIAPAALWLRSLQARLLNDRLDRARAEMRGSLAQLSHDGTGFARNTAQELWALRERLARHYASREELVRISEAGQALREAVGAVRQELRACAEQAGANRELLKRVERQLELLQEHVTAREDEK